MNEREKPTTTAQPTVYQPKPPGWECDKSWCWFRENRGTWDGRPQRR
jgi:hypothetical protein